jgi:hypothetical protein
MLKIHDAFRDLDDGIVVTLNSMSAISWAMLEAIPLG